MPKKQQKRSNGDGSIYYEKSRERWACAIIDPSGKRVVKRFKTEQEAKDHLTVVKSSIITNTYIKSSELTFGQWLIDYMKLYIIPVRTPTTVRAYTNLMRYAEPISEITLDKLNANALQNLINTLPNTINDTSKNSIGSFFRRALRKAVSTRLIPYNPMDGVVLPSKKTKEIEVFTVEEMHAICDYFEHHKRYYRYYVLFKTLFATGARIGEILALKDSDIRDDYIYISKSVKEVGSRIFIGKTKTKVNRKVYVPKSIIELLRSATPNDEGFLIYGPLTQQVLSEGRVQGVWHKALSDLNIPYRNIHVIRHTHATQLLENGVSITEVSKRLGHGKVTTTLNVYSHLLQDNGASVTEKVAEIFKI